MADSESRTKRRPFLPWVRGAILLALLAAVVAAAVVRGVDTGKLIVGLAIAVGLVLALMWSRPNSPTVEGGWRFSIKGLLASMAFVAVIAALASGQRSDLGRWILGGVGLIVIAGFVRRYPRMGLRVLGVAAILVGVGMLLVARERAPLAHQEQLGQAVAGMGAKVYYTYAGLPSGWQWLFRDKYVPIAAAAYFPAGTQLSETQISQLGECVALHTIEAPRTAIDDSGMAHLRQLNLITRLDLSGNPLGDRGAAHLSGMADLDFLNLAGTKIGDEGLGHLSGLLKLKYLDLSHTAITDKGMAALAKCGWLETLKLDHTAITGAGLKWLLTLPRLRYLSLRGSNISDQVRGSLATSLALQTLDLGETTISDAGLARLLKTSGAIGLMRLSLDGTKITDASCGRLSAVRG